MTETPYTGITPGAVGSGKRGGDVYHERSDVDVSAQSFHHTLGFGTNKAFPGNGMTFPEEVITFPFGTDWEHYIGWEEVLCERWGDLVWVHGLFRRITSASGTPSILGTMPDGWWPPAFVMRDGQTASIGRIDIEPDGDVIWRGDSVPATSYIAVDFMYRANRNG